MNMQKVDGKTVTTWDYADEIDWRSGCGLLSAVFVIGIVVGFIVGANLPPQSAPATVPEPSTADVQRSAVSDYTLPTAAGVEGIADASPEPTGEVGSVAEGRKGIIAYATIGGPSYLAIPIGPGHRVKICGPAACWTTVSTDAGPNHERLVAGRIADVAVGQWERICGLPRTSGTCRGSWHTVDAGDVGGPTVTPPATDR
jgi:hypothetical protein